MNRVEKPWDWYQNLYNNSGYKVKILFVEKEQKISLQYHKHRSEHWIVVEGSGKIELNSIVKDVQVGDYIFISLEETHRIYGGICGIMIVEVQVGSSCTEEDIVRLKDNYGRI